MPELDLVPGLRDRLIQELDQSRIPAAERVPFLAALTGRSPSTVRRWLTQRKPVLPDLEAFALICNWLQTDVNWFLGLSLRRLPLPKRGPLEAVEEGGQGPRGDGRAWIGQVAESLADVLSGCDSIVMRGDDMEPRICEGDVVFVDRNVQAVSGNGTYVLEYMGRIVVRTVEDRMAEGLVLRCVNPQYREAVVSNDALRKLKVLGRVRCSVGVQRF